jgi:hypothetical protein
MGPQAHFESSSKCGLSRIASRLSVEDNRHGAVVEQIDRHACAEDAALDRHALCGKRRTEPFVERIGLLGQRGSGEARPVALAGVLSLSEVNRTLESPFDHVFDLRSKPCAYVLSASVSA